MFMNDKDVLVGGIYRHRKKNFLVKVTDIYNTDWHKIYPGLVCFRFCPPHKIGGNNNYFANFVKTYELVQKPEMSKDIFDKLAEILQQ